MTGLGPADVRKVLALVDGLHLARDRLALGHRIVEQVSGVLEADVVSYNLFPVAGGDPVAIRSRPFDIRDGQAIFAHYYREHPIVAHCVKTRDPRAFRFSDVLPRRSLHRLGIYREYYRPSGIEHQLGLMVDTSSADYMAVAASRGPGTDFPDRDRAVLTAARSLLASAYVNVALVSALREELRVMGEGLARMRCGVVALTRDGAVATATPLARRWLSRYARWRGGRLPGAITDWLRRRRPGQSLTLPGPGTRLVITLAWDGDQHLLLLRESTDALDPARLAPLGLSPRQAQVLAWLAQGKTDHAIAVILGLSVRTVNHHVARVLDRLGAETRSAAAAIALETAQLAAEGRPQ